MLDVVDSILGAHLLAAAIGANVETVGLTVLDIHRARGFGDLDNAKLSSTMRHDGDLDSRTSCFADSPLDDGGDLELVSVTAFRVLCVFFFHPDDISLI